MCGHSASISLCVATRIHYLLLVVGVTLHYDDAFSATLDCIHGTLNIQMTKLAHGWSNVIACSSVYCVATIAAYAYVQSSPLL